MGLGPLQAIYQARFMRYMEHRGILPARAIAMFGVFAEMVKWMNQNLSAL